jgi:hypothetical protein
LVDPVPLKKTSCILFLAIFLLSTTELYQLCKLPILIQHLREHRAQNKELSILQFIDIHYKHGNVKDADYDRDMKLPFKKHEFTHHFTSSIIVSPITSSVLCQPPVYLVERILPLKGKLLLYSMFTANIWQPPRA